MDKSMDEEIGRMMNSIIEMTKDEYKEQAQKILLQLMQEMSSVVIKQTTEKIVQVIEEKANGTSWRYK